MIQETIKNFLQQHHISRDAGFILAVSGGADSICMLHAFKYLNLKMLVLHCNFSLRGKESDMDEQFVKRFCDSYGIAHSVKKFDTLKYARENGLSVEMAARELRYTWFREMKEKKKMDYIVVAHHADDAVEGAVAAGIALVPVAFVGNRGADIGIKLVRFPAEVSVGLIKTLHLGISRNTGPHNGRDGTADGETTQCPKHRSSGQFHSHSSFKLVCSFPLNIVFARHRGRPFGIFADIG